MTTHQIRTEEAVEHVGVSDPPESRAGWSGAVGCANDDPEALIEQMVGRRATLHLRGPWDDRARAAVSDAITALIEQRIVGVRIDVSRITRIDRDGSAAIRSALRRLAAARVEFRPAPSPRTVPQVGAGRNDNTPVLVGRKRS